MGEDWTEPQRAAIMDRGGHVVCLAAAGAGKTAVLTERVIGRLADPVDPLDIDQLLVVTFTRLAAAEMRQRIASALRQNQSRSPRAARQVLLLPLADISTLHSFCERTLRRHFDAAGCDPAFTVLSAGAAETIRMRTLEQLLAEEAPGGQNLLPLLERHGTSGRLGHLVLRVHSFARGQADPTAWLDAATERTRLTEEPLARAGLRRSLQHCLHRCRQALRIAQLPGGPGNYLPALESDQSLFEGLLRAVDAPWDTIAAALVQASFPALSCDTEADQRLAARVRQLRDASKDDIKSLRRGVYGRPAANLENEDRVVSAELSALVGLVREFDTRYHEAKRQENALDFDDLEHRLLAVLQAEGEAARSIRRRYREVLVDESQDLSPIQQELLSAIVGRDGEPFLFSVGDVRQSIYGFRHAAPERFVERAEGYGEEGGGRLLELPDNFRTRPRLVDGINAIFRPLFAAEGSDLPQGYAGPLQYRARYPELPNHEPEPLIELRLVEGEDLDPDPSRPDDVAALRTALEREASVVADRVQSWLAEKTPVWDHSRKRYRSATYGDVAILLRATTGSAAAYLAALQARSIPCWAADLANRQETVETRTVIAWLQTLRNPLADIPLAATLRGPLGGFTDADLLRIRTTLPQGSLWDALTTTATTGPEDLRPVVATWLHNLEHWRTLIRRAPAAEVVEAVLQDSGYVHTTTTLPLGAERQKTLNWIVERCREADRTIHGDLQALCDFLTSSDAQEGIGEAARAVGDQVRILSVHSSKGLEFPLVVIAGLGRTFSFRSARDEVLAHRGLGLGALAADPVRRLRWPTLRHAIIAEQLRHEERAEELRIAYVAMTRAKERLCLVGRSKDLLQDAAGWLDQARTEGGVSDLGDGRRVLDWIVPVLATRAEVAGALDALVGTVPAVGVRDPLFNVSLGPVQESLETDPAESKPLAADPDTTVDEALWQRLSEEADWQYPYAHLAGRYAKTSVGELARHLTAAGLEEPAAVLGTEQQPPLPGPRRLNNVAPSPAEVGSATHLLLSRIDLGGPVDSNAITRCLDRLITDQHITARVAQAVDVDSVARFLRSPLGERLHRNAGSVLREVPFLLRLPAVEVYPEIEADPHEWVLVQGTVDCLLVQSDHLILVDYKTDRAVGPSDRTVAQYREQVRLYARAMTAVWGRPVREAWIAFLQTGMLEPAHLR